MNGVDTGGAFDRVVVFRTKGSERGTTEAGTDTRLDGVGGQETGEAVHLPLDLDANDRDQGRCEGFVNRLAEPDPGQALQSGGEADASSVRPGLDGFLTIAGQANVFARGVLTTLRHQRLAAIVRRGRREPTCLALTDRPSCSRLSATTSRPWESAKGALSCTTPRSGVSSLYDASVEDKEDVVVQVTEARRDPPRRPGPRSSDLARRLESGPTRRCG